jgi:hypothetical protein
VQKDFCNSIPRIADLSRQLEPTHFGSLTLFLLRGHMLVLGRDFRGFNSSNAYAGCPSAFRDITSLIQWGATTRPVLTTVAVPTHFGPLWRLPSSGRRARPTFCLG